MISIEQVLKIHTIAISKFGGADGVRDLGSLEASLARPFQTFGGEDLYSTVFEKAAAVGESIIINHPFVDGNKRTGYLLMEGLIRIDGYFINASDEHLYSFVIEIAKGSISFEQITEWLKNNTEKR